MSGTLDVIIAEVARQELKDSKQDLTEFVALLEKAAGLKITFSADSSSVSTLKKQIEDLKASMAELKSVNAGALDTDKKITTAKLQLAEAISKEGKELANLRTKKNLVNAASRQEFKDAIPILNLYQRHNKTLKALKVEYRDLALKKELNGKISLREAARLSRLQKEVVRLDQAFKKTDANMGEYGRSVGNYAKKFDTLGFSVAQMTRESPAFLISMQTGFMALSNNIPIFVDEVTRLVDANKVLMAQGKPTVSVFKKVAGALFSWQSLMSFGIVLLTMYGKNLVEWIGKMFKGVGAANAMVKAMKELNEVQKEGRKNAGADVARLRRFNAALIDTSKTEKERDKILKAARAEYGTDIQHLTDKELLTRGLVSAEEDLTKAIIMRASVEAAEAKLGENIGKQLELEEIQLELIKSQTSARKNLTLLEENSVVTTTQYGTSLDGTQAATKRLNSANKALINNQEEIEELNVKNNKLLAFAVKNIDNLVIAEKKLKPKKPDKAKFIDVENKLREESVGWLEQIISLNNKEIKQSKDRGTIKKLQDENAEIQKKIDLLTKQINIEDIVEVVEPEEIPEPDFDTFRTAFFLLTQDLRLNQEELYDEYKKLYGEDLKNFKDFLKEKLNAELAQAEKRAAIEQGITEFSSALADSITEITISNIEERAARSDEYFENEEEKINNNTDSEAQKDEALRLLEEEKKKRDDDADKKKKKAEKKNFLFRQAISVADVLIADGLARARAIASTAVIPYPANLAALASMNVLIGINTGFSLATILAQAIPAFKLGKESSKKYEGLGLVNDGGSQEFRQNKHGIEAFQGRNTLTWVGKDDIIHKDVGAMLDYNLPFTDYDAVERAASATSLQIDRSKLNGLEARKALHQNLSNERFKQDIKGVLKGWKFTNNIDNSKVGEIVAEAIENLAYKNNLKL